MKQKLVLGSYEPNNEESSKSLTNRTASSILVNTDLGPHG